MVGSGKTWRGTQYHYVIASTQFRTRTWPDRNVFCSHILRFEQLAEPPTAATRAAEALDRISRAGDWRKLESNVTILTRRSQPIEAQPERRHVPSLGKLNRFPRQCFSLAIQKRLDCQCDLVSRPPVPGAPEQRSGRAPRGAVQVEYQFGTLPRIDRPDPKIL